jgi:hypothetical protein
MKKIIILYLLLFAFGSMFAQKPSITPKQKKESSLPESFLNLDLNLRMTPIIQFGPPYITSSPFVLKAMIGSKNSGIIIGFQACTFNKEQELLEELTEDVLIDWNSGQDLNFTNIQSSPGGTSHLVGDSSNDYNLNGLSMRLGYQKSIFKGLYANISADLTRIKTDVFHYYNNVSFDYIDPFDGNSSSSISYILTSQPDRTILGWRLNTGIGYTFSFGRAKKIYLNTEMVCSVFDRSKTIEAKFNLMAGLGFRFGTPAKTTLDNGTKTLRGVRTMP